MTESKELFSALSELQSIVSTAKSMDVENCLERLVAICKSASRLGWAYDADQLTIGVYIKFFEVAKRVYERCSEGATIDLSETDTEIARLSSLTYEVQSFFVELVPHCAALRISLLKPDVVKRFCILLFQLSNVCDKLDARISLPLWKLLSNLLQQYKVELNKAERSNLDEANENEDNKTILDEMMIYLLDSTRHYMKKCSESEKKNGESNGTTHIELKMLNLLGRVAAFCVREFALTTLSNKRNTNSELEQWLIWMMEVRYRGGLYPSGSGKSQTLAKSLESSAFLAIDVVLNHLLSHPVPNGKECSVAADLFRYQNRDPEIYCRIYGILLSALSRQPQYFGRWFNDEFNLLQELFTACAQVDFSSIARGDLNSELNERLNAAADEFYTTLLSQICACICALPASCFDYFESGLLSGILSERLWASLLATDVWCFLARYGTGDLCWQYVTTLADAVNRSALKLVEFWKLSQRDTARSFVISLDRIGRLLTRLIVFLTPKQQVEFLRIYRLSRCDPKPDGITCSLLWWFVPLQVERLHKSAQSLVRDQLADRLRQLNGQLGLLSSESPSQSDVFAAIHSVVTLHLIDTMSSSWREANAEPIAQLTTRSVMNPKAPLGSCIELPCASWISCAMQRPKSALVGHLGTWDPQLTVLSFHSQSEESPAHLLQWITEVSGNEYGLPQANSSFASFYDLRVWYQWLVCPSSTYLPRREQDSPNPQWLCQLTSRLRSIPIESVDTSFRSVLMSIIEKLQSVRAHVPDSGPSNKLVNNKVQKLTSALDLVEQHWKETQLFSVEDVSTLRQTKARLTSLLTMIESADQACLNTVP